MVYGYRLSSIVTYNEDSIHNDILQVNNAIKHILWRLCIPVNMIITSITGCSQYLMTYVSQSVSIVKVTKIDETMLNFYDQQIQEQWQNQESQHKKQKQKKAKKKCC